MYLSESNISDAGCAVLVLVNALKVNLALKELIISDNNIGDTGYAMLEGNLNVDTCIIEANLKNCISVMINGDCYW